MAGKKIERFGKFFKCKYFFFCRKREILLKIQFGEIVFVVFFLNFSINTSAEDKRGQQEQVHGD